MKTIKIEEFPDLFEGGWKIEFPMPAFKKDREAFIITRTEESLTRFMTVMRLALGLEVTEKRVGALNQLTKELLILEKRFII